MYASNLIASKLQIHITLDLYVDFIYDLLFTHNAINHLHFVHKAV